MDEGKIHAMRPWIAGQTALVISVQAEEREGNNAIPRIFAEMLADRLGVDADSEIVQANVVSPTGARGFHRIAMQPIFDGHVRPSWSYLIVDDFVGMGGTMANLRGLIEGRGGRVVGATTLTGKPHSAKIALDPVTLERLRLRHGKSLEDWWKSRFGGGFELLTESEAKYLFGHKNADTIRNRILEAVGQ